MNYMVNLDQLLTKLVTTTELAVAQKPMRAVVCMNEERPCEKCIFNAGEMARWCPPHERAAKAAFEAAGGHLRGVTPIIPQNTRADAA